MHVAYRPQTWRGGSEAGAGGLGVRDSTQLLGDLPHPASRRLPARLEAGVLAGRNQAGGDEDLLPRGLEADQAGLGVATAS